MEQKNQYLLGVDIGTSGCKVTIISTDGQIAATNTSNFSTHYPRKGWAEQNPEEWYEILCKTIKSVLSLGRIAPSNILAMALANAPHIVVLLDKEEKVVRPAILWTDIRSSNQTKKLTENYGEEIFDITFAEVNPTWSLSHLLWIKEKDLPAWKKTSKVTTSKGYLHYRLTGNYDTDYIDAMGTMLMDARKRKWSETICNTIGLDLKKLTPIRKPTDLVGRINEETFQKTKIPQGIPIIAGSSDTAAELLGAGAIQPGQIVVKLATAGVVFVVTNTPHPDPKLFTYYHPIQGLWYSAAATNSCTTAFNWFINVFCKEEKKVAKKLGVSLYALLDQKAMKVPFGSEGIIFHPYLIGERTPYFDPLLKASFTGISINHKKEHFIRAVMEGVSYSIKDCLLLLKRLEMITDKPKKAVLIGGGSKSQLWSSILCDTLGITLKKNTSKAASEPSLGAALIGGVGIGIFKNLKEATLKCLKSEEALNPIKSNYKYYNSRFKLYKRIQFKLAKINQFL